MTYSHTVYCTVDNLERVYISTTTTGGGVEVEVVPDGRTRPTSDVSNVNNTPTPTPTPTPPTRTP